MAEARSVCVLANYQSKLTSYIPSTGLWRPQHYHPVLNGSGFPPFCAITGYKHTGGAKYFAFLRLQTRPSPRKHRLPQGFANFTRLPEQDGGQRLSHCRYNRFFISNLRRPSKLAHASRLSGSGVYSVGSTVEVWCAYQISRGE